MSWLRELEVTDAKLALQSRWFRSYCMGNWCLLLTTEQVEYRVESVQDYEGDQLSSTGDSKEEESSSAGTKTDGALIVRVYYQVCIEW